MSFLRPRLGHSKRRRALSLTRIVPYDRNPPVKLVSIPANSLAEGAIVAKLRTRDRVSLRAAPWPPPPGRRGRSASFKVALNALRNTSRSCGACRPVGLLNTGAEIVTWPASANPGSLAAMGPNRRAQEREQAAAERKAAADPREIIPERTAAPLGYPGSSAGAHSRVTKAIG